MHFLNVLIRITMVILQNKELRKGMKKLKNRTDSEIDAIMESMDTDHNGAINFNEFISATLNSTVTKDYDRIYKAFEFFDLDGDGYIDEDELKQALSGGTLSEFGGGAFEEAIKQWDLDGDGKISFEEFTTWMSVKFEEMTKHNMNKSLKQVKKKQ